MDAAVAEGRHVALVDVADGVVVVEASGALDEDVVDAGAEEAGGAEAEEAGELVGEEGEEAVDEEEDDHDPLEDRGAEGVGEGLDRLLEEPLHQLDRHFVLVN